MTVTTSPPADLLSRMRQKAMAVQGAGMSTAIRSDDITGLLDHIDTLTRDLTAARTELAATIAPERSRSSKSKTGQATQRADTLVEVVGALAQIIQSHPELMGMPPIDALNAFCAQHSVFPDGAPDEWVAALNDATTKPESTPVE